ncbi:MAG: hypothetical protein R6X21_04990 [Candidatus Aminicenantes bacterium]
MKARGLLGLVLILALAASARAQGLSFSLSAGVFAAGQETYRELYGPGLPVAFEGWLNFRGAFGLSAGVTWLRDDGSAVAVSGEGEDYPLRFERLTFPLTFFFVPRLKGLALRLGAGLAFHSYREDWQTEDLGFEGTCLGPRVFAVVEVPVAGRLSLSGSLAYESIPTGVEYPRGERINLGGLQILGGVAFRVR